MKVVIVSKALVRGVYQRTLEELATRVDLTVVSPPGWREGSVYTPLERRFTRGYELIVTPVVFNGHYHVHLYPRLPALLGKIRPDLVHLDEEPYNLATWLGARAARRVGARRLFYTWQNLHRRLPPPFSIFENDVYRLSNGAIVANRDAETVLRAKGYRGPLAIIPPGLDVELYRPAERAPSETFTVGYAGRLVPEKGVDLLLSACRGLEPPWQLRLIGDGEQRPALEAQARALGIADHVAFVGAIPSLAIPAELQQLDVFVLASRTLPNWREQFGRVLMEAMACGVVVMGSDSGEIPRVIGDAGVVFPEDDAAALAAQLVALQRDRAWRGELSGRGRERVLANYSHRSVVEQTCSLYQQLVSK